MLFGKLLFDDGISGYGHGAGGGSSGFGPIAEGSVAGLGCVVDGRLGFSLIIGSNVA